MAYTDHPVWMFAPNWDTGVLEKLEWRTDVLTSEKAAEQRISRRLTPRRSFEATFLVQAINRQYLKNLLTKFASELWVVPLWHQVTQLTAAYANSSVNLPLDTRWREYNVGDLVIMRDKNNPQVFDIGVVQSVADGAITLTIPLERSWPAGSIVYPGRIARLQDAIDATKHTGELFELRARFTLEQTNPYPAASVLLPGSSMPLLDIPPDDSSDLSMGFSRQVITLDNEVGIPDTFDLQRLTQQRIQYRWSIAGREKSHKLRQFFYYLRGRAKEVALPTYMNDLTLAQDIPAGASSILVFNSQYQANKLPDLLLVVLRIEPYVGAVQYRMVLDVSDPLPLDTEPIGNPVIEPSTTELLHIGPQPLPNAITRENLKRISFVLISRLDQDTVEINHAADTDGLTQVVTTFYGRPGIPPLRIVATDTFKYLSTTVADTADYSAVDYDDSGWASGPGPFSDQNFFAPTEEFPAVGTITGAQVVWLRIKVYAPAMPISFVLGVDNNGRLFVNGTEVPILNVAFPRHTATYTPEKLGLLTIALRVQNLAPFDSAGNPLFAAIIATQ